MKITIHCVREVFLGDTTSTCGCPVTVDATAPTTFLGTPADSVELPVGCDYGHNWDAEEIALIRGDINAEYGRIEDGIPKAPEMTDADYREWYAQINPAEAA